MGRVEVELRPDPVFYARFLLATLPTPRTAAEIELRAALERYLAERRP